MNELSITGNVVTEPRLISTARGDVRASFRLAYNHRYYNRSTAEWVESGTTYLDVTCWRQMAEHIMQSVVKGQPVIVVGTLHVRQVASNVDPNQTRTFVEVEAKAIGPDLSRGVARFERVKSPGVVEQETRALAEVEASLEPAPSLAA